MIAELRMSVALLLIDLATLCLPPGHPALPRLGAAARALG